MNKEEEAADMFVDRKFYSAPARVHERGRGRWRRRRRHRQPPLLRHPLPPSPSCRHCCHLLLQRRRPPSTPPPYSDVDGAAVSSSTAEPSPQRLRLPLLLFRRFLWTPQTLYENKKKKIKFAYWLLRKKKKKFIQVFQIFFLKGKAYFY